MTLHPDTVTQSGPTPALNPAPIPAPLDLSTAVAAAASYARAAAGSAAEMAALLAAAARTYSYHQIVPAQVWTVTHNLGRYPAVSIVDADGKEVFADVQHINSNTAVITFSTAFIGWAYFN